VQGGHNESREDWDEERVEAKGGGEKGRKASLTKCTGKLNVSKWRYHEGHVKTGDKASVKSIFIPDSGHRNRAVHGDVVVVEIVGKRSVAGDEGMLGKPGGRCTGEGEWRRTEEGEREEDGRKEGGRRRR
jgi:hypothetical protein